MRVGEDGDRGDRCGGGGLADRLQITVEYGEDVGIRN